MNEETKYFSLISDKTIDIIRHGILVLNIQDTSPQVLGLFQDMMQFQRGFSFDRGKLKYANNKNPFAWINFPEKSYCFASHSLPFTREKCPQINLDYASLHLIEYLLDLFYPPT
jgi:hypothetical protein